MDKPTALEFFHQIIIISNKNNHKTILPRCNTYHFWSNVFSKSSDYEKN